MGRNSGEVSEIVLGMVPARRPRLCRWRLKVKGSKVPRSKVPAAEALMNVVARIVVVGLFTAAPAVAQEAAPAPVTTSAADARPAPSIKVDELPISIARIQRRLAQLPATTTEENHGLRLNYYIEVVGKAPPIDVLRGFDVNSGPVPFSAPTHQDFVRFVTPQEFSTPPFDLSAVMSWLAQRFGKSPR